MIRNKTTTSYYYFFTSSLLSINYHKVHDQKIKSKYYHNITQLKIKVQIKVSINKSICDKNIKILAPGHCPFN